MDFIKQAIAFIKSPLGSLACQFIVPLAKMGINWTPNKVDDYALAKTVYEITEAKCYGKEILCITLTREEQNMRLLAKQNLDIAYREMIEYKKSKKKK
jgi:hypothetical protein